LGDETAKMSRKESSNERTMPSSKATGNNRPLAEITRSIVIIRGHKVLLDARLAALYGVPTKRLNEQVRRNIRRFPEDFMFRLSVNETLSLRSQKNATSKFPEASRGLASQFQAARTHFRRAAKWW
jgi:hypothetical protein